MYNFYDETFGTRRVWGGRLATIYNSGVSLIYEI